MTLPGRARGLAAALGLGALALLPAWDAVLSLPSGARGWIPLAWLIGGTLVLTAATMACMLAGRPARFWIRIGVGSILAVLLFEAAAFLYVDLKNTLAVVSGPNYRWIRNLIAVAVVAVFVVVAWHGLRTGFAKTVRATIGGLALLAALPGVLIVSYLVPDRRTEVDESTVPARRVVVALILDELDDSAIEADLASLPNFGALRTRSLSATRMFPPANYTAESLPGMITGETFAQASYSRRDVHVLPEGKSHWESLKRRGTLFEDARRIGARRALIGWHLPYCTIVRGAHPCWDDAAYRAPGPSVGLPEWLLGHSRLYAVIESQLLSRKGSDVREYSRAFLSSAQNYRLQRIGEIFAEQRRMLVQTLESNRSELVFAHLACPHAPSFDRAMVTRIDMYQAYGANLRVCDGLLGDVLRTLERSRHENGWALVVTSDHWFRGRDWLEIGRPLAIPPARRTVPFYMTTARGGQAQVTDATTNSRVLRKLLVEAVDPGFTLGRARVLIESQGDSPTVLRAF